jgi:hypothetical protein
MKNKLMVLKARSTRLALVAAGTAASASASAAEGDSMITQLFAKVSTEAAVAVAAVAALGLVIIGIKMGEKGIGVAKRNISKI